MQIVVCIKQVPDTETQIGLQNDGKGINPDNIKWIINPYDEFAVEQALLVKASNPGSSVTVIRVGPILNPEIIRTAIAMGADDGIFVETSSFLDSYLTAQAIVGAINFAGISPGLIFTGKKAIDLDSNQVPAIIAQLLSFPLVTEVAKMEQKENYFIVQKAGQGQSSEVYRITTPCVISANKGLNTPRYPSLPGILRAKNRPLVNLTLSQLGIDCTKNRLHYRHFAIPPQRRQGMLFYPQDLQETTAMAKKLINHLRSEEKVI